MQMLNDLRHGNAHMAFIIHTCSIADHQHLRRFVVHLEYFSYLVGKASVGQQVQKIKINIGWLGCFL